ncbi:uncharacterized protein LOC113365450 [Ctenocephalides felis]|uniref:uncharacterized protein LOC113365450 n=1 Tax=Ctenocephalides felis TaxID=7515 RepID=UPI000E6E1588|nr:uncharacterized protein LOC113365450 [Ctenocephalides felis]
MQCVLCKKRHLLFKCEDFKKLTVKERISRANQLNVCTNCLNTNHHIDNCPASFRCVVCHEKHNTLLHCEEPSKKPSNDAVPSTSFFSNEIKSHVLLSTAVISALNKNGAWVPARILLDSGSQSNFITQEFSKKLSLKSQPIKMSVSEISILNNNVEKFWELEKVENANCFSDCELECERHFVAHTNRNFDGRFVVRIPFKYNKIELGNSKQIALKRFALLEKRFKANTELFKEYKNFIDEYLKLGHMREVNEFREPTNAYYLPHHPVIKKESLTTKLRVVFDASCETSNGRSLNDLQAVGPTIQKDIFSILLRFRRHKYALTADIEKMYRQVIIHKDDRKFQRIFWRDNSNDSIKCFELNTVTYGTASAPFLAIRCLEQLCKENYETYPIECEIIRKDFYVDDLITGADTLPQLKTIKQNLLKILNQAKFNLRKFNSNHVAFQSEDYIVNFSEKQIKTLGMVWNSYSDKFAYTTDSITISNKISKRTILATTAQIYDPLGLLAPVVIIPKLIMQELWKCKLSWDEETYVFAPSYHL